MGDNKTLEQMVTEIEAETDSAKAKELLAAVPDDQKKSVSDALTKKASEAIDQIAGLREAKREQERLTKEAEDRNRNANKTFEQKMLEENSEKALGAIFSELGVEKEEEKNQIRDEFKRRNPQQVTVENLIVEARKAAVAANPEKFTGALQRVKDLQQGADEFNRGSAGNTGGFGESGDDDKKFSKEARALAQKSGVTVEQAQAYIDDGGLSGNRRFELGKKKK